MCMWYIKHCCELKHSEICSSNITNVSNISMLKLIYKRVHTFIQGPKWMQCIDYEVLLHDLSWILRTIAWPLLKCHWWIILLNRKENICCDLHISKWLNMSQQGVFSHEESLVCGVTMTCAVCHNYTWKQLLNNSTS